MISLHGNKQTYDGLTVFDTQFVSLSKNDTGDTNYFKMSDS
jgi:hypothetical protein